MSIGAKIIKFFLLNAENALIIDFSTDKARANALFLLHCLHEALYLIR